MMLLSLPMFAADDLYVRQSSGDTRISIGSIKEITFPSGQVVVTMTDGSKKLIHLRHLYLCVLMAWSQE